MNELRLEVNTNTSDQGKREWLWSGTLSRVLTDRIQVYLRYASSRSGYDQYQSGNTNRIGIGIRYEFLVNFILTQEFSGDIHRGGQNGSMTSLVYQPSDSWRFGLTHTNFAEDLPLRAKTQLIEANRSYGFVDFHTLDYRWSWFASGARYEFSDSNTRNAFFSSAGYAYELTPQREQRIYLEYYESSNTLADTVYFNPAHDQSITIVHKTDFVFNTRFRRHVDHLYLSAGQYSQRGFSTHGIWDMRYEQDYDINKRMALAWGLGFGRHVYDGAHEYETSLSASYRLLF